MKTFKTVTKELREFCESHAQIARYIFDNEGEINNGINDGYPLIYTQPLPSESGKGFNVFSLSIACMDLALEDYSDTENIYSKTHDIISDIRAYFANVEGGNYFLGDSISLTPIQYDQNDRLHGWEVVIDFEAAASVSGCEIPSQGEAPFAGLLDLVPNAERAYSLRLLRGGYLGSAIRVRFTDNTESDIGFANNELDTEALLNLAGSGDAYVTTVYDQSGQALDATEINAANQPKIVNQGVLEVEGLKSCINFISANQNRLSYSVASLTEYTVLMIGSGSDNGGRMISAANSSNSIAINSNANFVAIQQFTGVSNINFNSITNEWIALISRDASSNGTSRVNGQDGLNSVSLPNKLNVSTFAERAGFSNVSWKMQEVIFWNRDIVADWSSIEQNANDYYQRF
ncbi:MAG: hypothetical protein HRU12_07400 [Phaeodactylibacter sp.]|nr:hypothetical protein [Phaeodactylibacter sp.]